MFCRSFRLEDGTGPQLYAADVVYAVTALLEAPPAVRPEDAALPDDKADHFWCAITLILTGHMSRLQLLHHLPAMWWLQPFLETLIAEQGCDRRATSVSCCRNHSAKRTAVHKISRKGHFSAEAHPLSQADSQLVLATLSDCNVDEVDGPLGAIRGNEGRLVADPSC